MSLDELSRQVVWSRAARLLDELADAERKSVAASLRRRELPPGSSRARVTTANARWMSAAEHRDRVLERVREIGIDPDAITVAP